jgi:hypothetical protein
MGKRSYRSTAFEEMDWSAVVGRIEGARVVLAVDVAKETFSALIRLASLRLKPESPIDLS